MSDNTPTGGAWVFGYPCGEPTRDPVTGACKDHQAPWSRYDEITRLLRA
jgi:hypothetical protein